ncbi:MAG TPA: helix-turn-helix domain-containing protein [Candidatus Oscillibacter excrementigallinarum]|uniref:Helix-turn-helix domain-containing protein n=1 Tax=Candidatus Oscillibacter excrementigallinarum TaxID=2838716 RepID=A0A9D2LKA4_9FIRM|nr:helix-turn-helix domain-containing protein [Candidatus Oscillibacter excrementigallinarum]
MWEKPTDDLGEELMSADSIDTYLHDNEKYFFDQNITETLAQLYERKAVSKATLARQSGMSEVYLHQVFSGRRNPSRDRLLCLCIGLDATLEETQRLLKLSAYAQLYPRSRRDAIIAYGILHHMELHTVNDKLFAENERTLC